MQKLSSQPINTFSVGFNEFGFDESKKAKAISSFLGTNHNEVVLTSSEAIKIIPTLKRSRKKLLENSRFLIKELNKINIKRKK